RLAAAPTHTPTHDLPHVLVAAAANIRSGPGVDFSIIAVVSAGSSITLSQRQGDWYKVRTADGHEGWMSKLVLEVDPAVAASVPLAQP
ncbi:MAG: SH3 domain-containing protein, partial [Chloroflexales bacterium]